MAVKNAKLIGLGQIYSKKNKRDYYFMDLLYKEKIGYHGEREFISEELYNELRQFALGIHLIPMYNKRGHLDYCSLEVNESETWDFTL